MIAGGRRGGLHEVIALPAKILGRGVHVGLCVFDVSLGQTGAVPNQYPFSHFDGVAGHSDEALHEVLRRIFRVLEDDDVAAMRITQTREPLVREWHFGAIDELVHEQEVADLQRLLHAPARNLEGFDEKRADHAEQHDRYEEDLRPFRQEIEAAAAAVELAEGVHALLGRDRTPRGAVGAVADRYCYCLVRAHGWPAPPAPRGRRAYGKELAGVAVKGAQ